MDITIRGLDPADVPAWNRLLAEAEKVDRTGEHYNEADLAEEMANPDLEPGKDIVGAFDGDDLVGYFNVYARSGSVDLHKIHLDGVVRPDHRGRGLGTRMARLMRERASEVHAGRHPDLPALLALRGLSDNTAQADVLAEAGFVPGRWSFVMRADLADLPENDSTVPDGLELRRYDDTYAAAMHAAHNAAFVDHPNFTTWSETMWKQWVTESRSFRPLLSFLVLDPARPGEVAAYLQTSEYDATFEMTGRREAYVGKVGTRREYRGRGLAGTLLAHALREYRAAGYDEASLDVDSENPSGALGIYERAGFVVARRFTDYELAIPPRAAAQE